MALSSHVDFIKINKYTHLHVVSDHNTSPKNTTILWSRPFFIGGNDVHEGALNYGVITLVYLNVVLPTSL